MYGFKKKAQRFADGGMIRGKGTGTSDSIKAKMPEGTYVMPADTTKQLGLGKPVDVRVSNGEFALPPKAVHAIGAQVLDTIKGATHKPAGFAPQRMHLADGGLLERMFGGEPKKVSPEQQAAAQAALEARRAKQEQPQQGVGGYAGMSKREQQMRDMGLKDGGIVKGYATGGLIEEEKKPMLGSPQGFRTIAQGAQVLPGKPEAKTPSPLSPSLDPLGLNRAYANTIASTKEATRDKLFAPSMAVPQAQEAAKGAGDAIGGAMLDMYKNQYNNPADKAIAAVGDAAVNYAEVAKTGAEPANRTRIQDSITPTSTPVATATPAGAVPPPPAKPAGFKPETYAATMIADQDAAFAATPATKDVMSNGIVIEGRDKNGKANSFSGSNIADLATGKGSGNLSVMDTSGLRDTPYYKQAVAELSGQQQVAPQNQIITIGENGGFGFDKKDPALARTEAIQSRVEDMRRAAGIRAATPKMIEAAVAEYGAYDNVANNQLNNQTAQERTAADSANNAADRQSRDNQYGVQNQQAAVKDSRDAVKDYYGAQNLGFEAGAKARLDKAQSDVMNAKTPAEQKAAQERLYALMGKIDESYAPMMVDRWDANAGAFGKDAYVLNKATGEVRPAQTGQQGQVKALPLPSDKKQIVVGQIYDTPNGPSTWDGKQFHTLGE